MIRFGIGMVIGALIVFAVHSKLDTKTRANVDKQVAATVDSAGATALDATQQGLTKANQALSDARKDTPAKK